MASTTGPSAPTTGPMASTTGPIESTTGPIASTTGPLAPTTTKPVTTTAGTTETTTAVVEPFCKDAKGNMYISGSTWMENECLECACVGTQVKCAELTKCVKTPTTSATESTTLPVAPNTTPEVTTRAVSDEVTTVKSTESPATTVKSTESPATTVKSTESAPVQTTPVATER